MSDERVYVKVVELARERSEALALQAAATRLRDENLSLQAEIEEITVSCDAEVERLRAEVERLLALLDADDDTRERLAALVGSAYPWIEPHPLDVVDMVLAALREEIGDGEALASDPGVG